MEKITETKDFYFRYGSEEEGKIRHMTELYNDICKIILYENHILNKGDDIK